MSQSFTTLGKILATQSVNANDILKQSITENGRLVEDNRALTSVIKELRAELDTYKKGKDVETSNGIQDAYEKLNTEHKNLYKKLKERKLI